MKINATKKVMAYSAYSASATIGHLYMYYYGSKRELITCRG
jgi:hypothetical protein